MSIQPATKRVWSVQLISIFMKVLQIVLGLVKLHFLKCKINIIGDVAGTLMQLL